MWWQVILQVFFSLVPFSQCSRKQKYEKRVNSWRSAELGSRGLGRKFVRVFP